MSRLSPETPTIGRNAFIRRWMDECGVTYDAASRLYRTMVTTFEDGIANAQKVTIGRLGALVPHHQSSRTATMGFRRVKGGIIKQKQQFFLDSRVKYRFKIYKEWMAKSHLNWSQ